MTTSLCVCVQLLALSHLQNSTCFGSNSGRRSRCQTPRRTLTYVDRCMVPGPQLAKVLICVDTKRLSTLAIPLLHSKTSSSAARSFSEVISRHSLNMTQGPLAQQQPAPAVQHPPQIRRGPGEETVPAFLSGTGIHKVVKSLISRLSSAPGQLACLSQSLH